MQMTNKVETKDVPDRVDNFGSNGFAAKAVDEPTITPENIDSHAESLPRPTGYRILILPFTQSTVTKGGIHLAKATVDKERLATVVGYVRFQIEGGDMRLLNDDEILACIDNPEAILS